jgi:hypothetical protein
MRRDELSEKIRAKSLIPVHVSGFGDDRFDSQCWDFEGSIDEFLQIAQGLDTKPIFVNVFEFDAEDFAYSPDEDDENGDGDLVDLIPLRPELARYREHIGELAGYELVMLMGTDVRLRLVSSSDEWYSKFCDLRDEAIAQLDLAGGSAREAEEREAQGRHDAMHKRLDSLASDPEFMRLPSKAAMLAFMRERVPELDEELDSRERTVKVAELYAKAHLARARSRK